MPPKKIVKEEEEEVVVGGGGDNNNSFEGNVFFIIGEAKDEKGKALTKTELAKLKKDIEEEGGKLFTRITAKVNWLIVGTPKDTADQTRAKKISDEKSVENFVTLEAVRNALSSGSAFTDADKKAGEEAFQKAFLTDSVEPPTKKIKEEEDEEEEKEEKEKEEEEEKEEGKKIVVKGRAAVDEYVPGGDGMMVYQEPDVIWDCMLNQTNIAGNNNKFYKIQLLVKEGTTQYYIWNRWGRVGERGQNKLMPMSGLPYAKADFEKKFREKTKNNWANRANFVSHPGKYTLLEIDYNPDEDSDGEKKKKEEEEDNNNNEEEEAEEKKEAESKLDKRVQDLIKLIFDMKMMESVLTSEFEFDAKKQPLGKLTKKQIKDGYLVLQEIEKAFKRSAGATEIMELSSRFYTLIPHCFGRMRPPSINTSELLKKKMKMLESLADIEVAVKLIKDSAKKDKDAEEQLALVDINYRKLNAELTPLEKDDSEYKLIETYVANTHPRNTPKIKSIFRLKRAGEHERYVPKMPLGNRKLLWHGSRLTNFVGILSQGLRIAPPEAPCSGYRFGKGIYFADICGFASNYCRSYGQKDFLMLLGDVALGKSAELASDQYMEKPISGYNSTKALGTEEPDPKENGDIDGCVVPKGQIVPSGHHNVSCIEHQYIVYDVAQVELKYLVHFNQ